ncbi:insulinase family protein [Candidatus Babeliales bacterium]|nr:insulinase family protein [Candidatus Babeliales bacterium]MBP9843471.1 insulinase family protein [Candidatus Babeliales bacterium]
MKIIFLRMGFIITGLLQICSVITKDRDIFMQKDRVVQSSLENGLTILVCPKKGASTVSIQLWYKVGSKHEKSGERGIAHFIEHMIFKGTDTLSESDINRITNKLSGSCNAFTWYDYTGYLFDIPVANWDKVLPVMADCMENCTFKQAHLNSELKAVIQELKMCKDNHIRSVCEDLITNIFESHPYHYPTIGFKQDLWSVTRETLLAFYKKYYTPDNAVMVVVGDVSPEYVHEKVAQAFGKIPAGNGWNTESFFVNEDIKAKSVRLYRDIKQQICTIGYVLPGIINQNKFEMESFTYILGNGRGSRLYKLLINELQLVASVSAYVYEMFDHAMLFVEFNPKKESDIQLIIDKIQNEIDNIAFHGPTLQEVERAQRITQIEHQEMLEDTQRQAYAIGESFIATRDAFYPFNYGHISSDLLITKIKDLAANYCPKVLRHEGQVLSIPQADIARLNKLQQLSDEEDSLMLGAKEREEDLEEGSQVHNIFLNPKKPAAYITPQAARLSNGLDLIWSNDDVVDIVECQFDLAAKSYYDPQGLEGLGYIVSKMMMEGTKNHPGQSFADEVESYGMSFSVVPGSVGTTMLKQDVEKGLALLTELLTQADFTQKALDKVKANAAEDLKNYWDTPKSFIMQLARKAVYKDHPYSRMVLGSKESLDKISLEDCIDYYQKNISPQGCRLSIVGNLGNLDLQAVVEKTLGQWQGAIVEKLSYPVLAPVKSEEILSFINRDQIVLMFAGLSINRLHEDYDKILLFEQILTGGILGSMGSRLFELREQSGLFYTIGGSLVAGANNEPGMIYIRTIVSPDRIAEAEIAIAQVLDEAINDLPEEELQEAKNALINSFDSLYESNEQKASTFLFLKKYDLPFDYFEKRVETLQKITASEVKEAVKKILSTDKLVKIKVGRV